MREILKSLTLCLFLASSFTLLAQSKKKPEDYGIKSAKALKLYDEGLLQAQYRDRDRAIALFEEALKLEPEFAHAHFQLGVNAWVRKKYEDAEPHLEKAWQLRPGEFAGIEFYLGETYYHNTRYADAIPLLETFFMRANGRKEDLFLAGRDLRHARFAAEAVKNPVAFTPRNMGEAINTDRDEYLPCLTADDTYLLFTARRPESVGGYNAQLQDYSEDFFYSIRQDTGWTASENLGAPINTAENEGSAFITEDGQTIYFAACNLPGGFGSCDLYFAVRVGKGWGKPQILGPEVNSDGWESYPRLSPDGRTLYFASARSGGEGGRDIWVSEWAEDHWSTARNLGKPVNTLGNEDAPFLHADGLTLYFSSDYHPGFGQRDLFFSQMQSSGVWAEPKNLGYPLNTQADESNIFVNASGKMGYINSDREGGIGRSDLYDFTLDQRIRPQVATFLRGMVVDSLTRKPLASQIRLVEVVSGDTIRQAVSSTTDGRFLMSLPLEKEYAAFVQAPGYLFASKNFYLKGLEEETYFDLEIALSPIQKGVQVVLKNIFFESGKYELAATSDAELQFVLRFMQENPRMRIEIQGHTDDIGSATDNLALSQRRADAVKSWLADKGIDATRVTAKGYGESMPVAGNITDEDRAQNRRTEFKVLETGR